MPELVIASIERPQGRTGMSTHVRELRRYLDSEGIPTTLVTPYSWGRSIVVPVFAPRLILAKVHKATSIAWYYYFHELFLRRALRRHLATGNAAVVYAQGPPAARAALRARRSPDQRVVMVVHFLSSEADEWVAKGMLHPGSRIFRRIHRIESETIPTLDGIVYVTETARNAVAAWLPNPAPTRAAVITNFIQPHQNGVTHGPQADLVTVGRLELPKNHAYLLDILAAANQMGKRYTLDVYGAGPQRIALVKRAADLGLSDQVRFLGFRPDVRASLPAYRVYVHTSLRESQGLALIEAMAAGLPLVVADRGGIREVCGKESGARFWPLDDANLAASILIELLDNEVERARAGCKALGAFHERFDSGVVASRLYDFLVNRCGAPAESDGSFEVEQLQGGLTTTSET